MRPHLEFSTPAWAPWAEGDKNVLEKVQRKAVGMVSSLRSKVYEERLKELGLQTLEERRHQADMCMMHKIMHGLGGIDHRAWFEKACDGERLTRVATDNLNVKVMNGRLDLRKNFFSVRSSSKWNMVGTTRDKADHACPLVQEGVQEAQGVPDASHLDETRSRPGRVCGMHTEN